MSDERDVDQKDFQRMTNAELADWLDYPLLAHQTHPYDEWKAAVEAIRDRLRSTQTREVLGYDGLVTVEWQLDPQGWRWPVANIEWLGDHLTPGVETRETEVERYTLEQIDAALYAAHREWDASNMASFSSLMVKHLRAALASEARET